jgi:hypothetical protein
MAGNGRLEAYRYVIHPKRVTTLQTVTAVVGMDLWLVLLRALEEDSTGPTLGAQHSNGQEPANTS